jgi:hypothetical protein
VGDGIRIFNITDPTNGSAPPLITLKGLTLKGGDPVRNSGNQDGNGGAIFSEARLEIFDCTIEENEAFSGGGIHIKVAGDSPTMEREILAIEDSVIQNNEARSGGGIDIDTSDTTDPTSDLFSITRTTISNNHALSTGIGGSGGGIFAALYGAALTVTDSHITGNTAAGSGSFIGDYGGGGGGGIYAKLDLAASLEVIDSEVSGNEAERGNGGGILAKAFRDPSGDPFPAQKAITISGSLISNNSAGDSGGGREHTFCRINEEFVTIAA